MNLNNSKKPNAGEFYPSFTNCKKGNEEINVYLDTILLNINYDDSCCQRNVRENINWVNGYLERYEGFHYGVSTEFIKLADKSDSIVEHAFPSKVMSKLILSQNISNRSDLLSFLKANYSICLITKMEDKKLKDLMLNEKMPDGWNPEYGWKKRYDVAKITLEVLPGIVK